MIHEIMKFIKFIGLDNWITMICSLVGLLGVYFTIQFTRNQFKEDKRIGVKPYLDLKINNSYCQTKFSEGDYFIKFINEETLFVKDKDSTLSDGETYFYFELDLENIGLGHALDYKVNSIYGENIKFKGKDKIDIIRKDNKKKIWIEISKGLKKEYLDFLYKAINDPKETKKIKEKELNFDRHYPNDYTVSDKLKIKSKEEVYIDIQYKDILNNQYKKIFCLEFYFYIDKNPFATETIIKGKSNFLREKTKEYLIKKS